MHGWSLCSKGLAWNIGKGDLINLWNNRWIPNLPPLRTLIQGSLPIKEENMLVRNILVHHNWKFDDLSFSIPSDIKDAIQNIHINNSILTNDKPYWFLTNSGIFSIKSAISLITPSKDPFLNISWIWKLKSLGK